MTRRSRREIERALDAIDGPAEGDVHGGPLTAREKAAIGADAEGWDETPTRRKLIRALGEAPSR